MEAPAANMLLSPSSSSASGLGMQQITQTLLLVPIRHMLSPLSTAASTVSPSPTLDEATDNKNGADAWDDAEVAKEWGALYSALHRSISLKSDTPPAIHHLTNVMFSLMDAMHPRCPSVSYVPLSLASLSYCIVHFIISS